MMSLQDALASLVDRQDLSREQMSAVMRQVMSGDATDAQIGGLLVALRMKGETIDEIVGAVRVMREKATFVDTGVNTAAGEVLMVKRPRATATEYILGPCVPWNRPSLKDLRMPGTVNRGALTHSHAWPGPPRTPFRSKCASSFAKPQTRQPSPSRWSQSSTLLPRPLRS